MTTAGTVEIAIKASGSAKFIAQVQEAVDKLKLVGAESGRAGNAAEKLSQQTEQTGNSMGKFAKLAQSAAAAAAAFAGVKFAQNLAASAHQANVATQAFQSLGGNIERLRKATGGMVSDADLVKRANLAQTMGINNAAFEKMAVIAQASAAKTGQSMSYLFESIIVGSARQSKLILDNLGIIVNVDKANQDYARTLGKSSAVLNDVEKKQAFMNAVMAQGDKMMKEMADAGISLISPFDVLSASVDNAATMLGSMLIPTFVKLFDVIQPVFDAVKYVADIWKRLTPGVRDAISTVAAFTVVMIALPVVINAVSGAVSLLSAVFMTSVRAVSVLLFPLIKVVAVVGSIISSIAIARVAWEENWAGIKTSTLDAWAWIKRVTYASVVGVVAYFYFMRDSAALALSKLGQLVVAFIFAPVELVIKALDMLMGAFANMMAAGSLAFSAMGMDKEAATFARAADDIDKAMVKVSRSVGEARDALAGKLEIAEAPNWKRSSMEAKNSVDSTGGKISEMVTGAMQAIPGLWNQLKAVGGEMGGKFLDLVGQGLKLILKDLGIELLPEGTIKKTSKGLADATGGAMSEELVKARKDFAGLVDDLRARDKVTSFQDPFRGVAQVSADLVKELRSASEKAQKAGMSMDEAGMLIRRNAGREYAERINGITNLAQWNQAVALASREALAMGVDLKDVSQNLKFQPADVSDIMTGRVSEIFDVVAKQSGLAIAQGDKQSIVEAISKGISAMLKDGKLDFDLIGKAIGGLLGSTAGGSQAIGDLFGFARMGSKSVGAGGQAASVALQMGPGGLAAMSSLLGGGSAGASAAAGGVSALAGGTTGAAGGPAGAAIGASVAGIVAAAIPMVIDAFKQAAQAIMDAAKAVPEAISGVIQKIAGLIPGDKIKGIASEAFSPMVVSIGLAVGAFAALSGPLSVFAALMGPVIVPALLLLSAAINIAAPMALFVAAALVTVASVLFAFGTAVVTALAAVVTAAASLYVILASLVSAVVMAVTPIGAITALMAGSLVPALVIATAGLMLFSAVAATVIATIGLFISFMKLAADTKSFETFKRAFEGSIARVVTALEPFFTNLLPLAGLFDALVSVVIPLAAAFASNEAASRILFEVFKFLAIGLGVLVMAVGYLVTGLLAGVIAFADGMIGFIRTFQFVQMTLNGFADMLLNVGAIILMAIRWAFDSVLPDSLKSFLDGAANRMLGAVGTGSGTTGAVSGLYEISQAAQGLSPDLEAMGSALSALTNLTYDEAMTRASILAKEKDMNESLTNIPQGFKVAAARFRAIQSDAFGSATGVDAQAGGSPGNNFFIDKVNVAAENLDEFAASLTRAAETQSLQQTGTTSTRDGLFNGRG